ncbi:MAG TPA: hypothetical protein PKE24_07595 [Thauera aminoaromatica]|nr:hypothetical protein [Thauera aminoaromatica]
MPLYDEFKVRREEMFNADAQGVNVSNSIYFPMKIDDFIFNEESFFLKNKEYKYSEIESLKFFVVNESINFSKDEVYNFMMRMTDDVIYSITIRDAAFSINRKRVAAKKESLLSVYKYINKITFEKRFERYFEQLRINNHVIYKFLDVKLFGSKIKAVRICNDGNVYLDGRTVNLKNARADGTLKFGTAYGLGCDKTIDPYEISINEKKPILGGLAEGSGSLRIDGGWDYPIIFEILKSFS